jgi:HD-GYP domain-containing protein (c-di-GMP phosphodiesterase class II)
VDIFDALTTKRSYRKAVSTAKALETLGQDAESGGSAKDLVECFIELQQSRRLTTALHQPLILPRSRPRAR